MRVADETDPGHGRGLGARSVADGLLPGGALDLAVSFFPRHQSASPKVVVVARRTQPWLDKECVQGYRVFSDRGFDKYLMHEPGLVL
jgi:hypothetical protein